MTERFVLLLKLNKVQPSGIVPPAMYAEYCGGELVQGYMKLTNTDYAWHVWVEKDGYQYDINKMLYKLYNKDFQDLDIKLYKNIPEESKVESIEGIVKEWELYNQDPQKFWKSVPKNIREVKSKIFKSLK